MTSSAHGGRERDARARSWRAIVWACLALASALCWVLPATQAQAATPTSCPTRPADSTSTDDAVVEMRALRQDVADACAATADRLDQLHADLGGQLDVRSAQLDGDLAQLHADLGQPLSAHLTRGDDPTQPLYVDGSAAAAGTVKLDQAQADGFTAQGGSIVAVLWAVVGAICGALAIRWLGGALFG